MIKKNNLFVNETPQYMHLPVDILRIEAYQESRLDMLRAQSYANNYNPSAIGSVIVSHRNNNYYIVDGQHRVVATRLRGNPNTIMCEIIEGLTIEQECDLFLELNKNRKPIDYITRFKARVMSKEKKACDIYNMLESFGLEISKSKSKTSHSKILAISTLDEIYKSSGYNMLYKVLELITNTWNKSTISYSKTILSGMHTFLKSYKHIINEKTFINQLQKIHPSVIIMEGNNDKVFSSISKSGYRYAKPILFYYNKGLISKKRLDESKLKR
jgi:hypothetical protein